MIECLLKERGACCEIGEFDKDGPELRQDCEIVGKALENSLVCNTGLLEVRRGAGSRMRQDATVLKSPVSLASVARSHRASMFDGSRL